MAAASVASARSVPAISRPSALNAAVPARSRTTTAAHEPRGSQPSSWATTTSSTTCIASIVSTASPLAASSAPRGSGEAPSRLSAPYRRSKPVPIASPVNAVDMTASASTPGTRKSTRAGAVAQVHQLDAAEDREDQHGDDHGQQQLLAVAQHHPDLEGGLGREHPRQRGGSGCGVNVPVAPVVLMTCSSAPVSSRKTSSSERRPTVSPSGITSRSAHHAGQVGEQVRVDRAVHARSGRGTPPRRGSPPAAHAASAADVQPGGPAKRRLPLGPSGRQLAAACRPR